MLHGMSLPKMDDINAHRFLSAEQRDALMAEYYHPILAKFGELGREMGHGGMDYIMDARLVYCLQNGLPLDMDVYDMAEWCCIAELGALSMDNNCASVAFPDFTRGHWNDKQGYSHAYATSEAEADARARAYTATHKRITAECNLWSLYDAAQSADSTTAQKAQKRLNAAKAMARKSIDKQLAK